MISLFGCPISCGLVLLGGTSYYSTPEAFMKDLVTIMSPKNSFTQFVYTHRITGSDIGRPLMEYIHENNLGIVVESAPGANPVHETNSTGITVWTWTRNLEGWDRYVAKTGLTQGSYKTAFQRDVSDKTKDHVGARTEGIAKDSNGYVPYDNVKYRKRAAAIFEQGMEAFAPKDT